MAKMAFITEIEVNKDEKREQMRCILKCLGTVGVR